MNAQQRYTCSRTVVVMLFLASFTEVRSLMRCSYNSDCDYDGCSGEDYHNVRCDDDNVPQARGDECSFLEGFPNVKDCCGDNRCSCSTHVNENCRNRPAIGGPKQRCDSRRYKCPDPPCPSGTFNNNRRCSGRGGGTTECTCTSCPSGQYSLESATTCADCGAGTYSPAGASACVTCGAGQYSNVTGATTCVNCGAGTYSPAGATACVTCGAGKYSGAKAATVCVDCDAGKYCGSESATVCVDCVAGTYVNVTGATSCFECSRDPCPFPGTFELFSCTPKTNKVCEVYVHNVPVSVKMAIALGQTAFVLLISYGVWICCGLRRDSDENWKWTLFGLVVGVHDVVSDFTTLSLIPIKNPFMLFWVSLGSILCSMITSLVLSLFSTIELSWPTRAFLFISSTAEDFGHEWPEKWNFRTLVLVENFPQLLVQVILVYLQGSQGFTGWDWAIWAQTLLFTLANGGRKVWKNGGLKVWKNICGQTTDQTSKRDGVQMIDVAETVATATTGVLITVGYG
jgi:hypothetical protein